MTSKRTRVVGLAATLASVPFLLPGIAGANGNGNGGSSKDPNSYPPLPGECAGQSWYQWVDDPAALTLADTSPYVVLPMNLPAGLVSVPEAITWDARAADEHEQTPKYDDENQNDVQSISVESHLDAELNESMRVEFYKDDTFLGATPFFTPDLLDDNPYAWSVSDLGSVQIAQAANQVVLAHSSTFMATDGTPNRFFPKGICVTSVPDQLPPSTSTPPVNESKPSVELTNDCDSATLTMSNAGNVPADVSYGIAEEWTTLSVAPGETVTKDIPLTEDEPTYVEAWADDQQVVAQVVTPDCVGPTEVLAQTDTAELAFTGSDTARNTGIGAALLAAGVAMLAFSRRRRVEA